MEKTKAGYGFGVIRLDIAGSLQVLPDLRSHTNGKHCFRNGLSLILICLSEIRFRYTLRKTFDNPSQKRVRAS